MKHLRLLIGFWALTLFIASCDSGSSEVPLGELEQGVLIINEGNFSDRDGDISHYNPTTGMVKNNVFEIKNARPYAGLVQDLVEADGRIYVVANTGKIEVVETKDFNSIGAVSQGLDITQSLVTANNKLYISDWGPYDPSYNSPNSYIAVVNNLNGGEITKKILVSSRPSGMFVLGNNILVACAADKKMQVISLASDSMTESKDVEGTPVRFFEQAGKLYLFARDAGNIYLHEINRNNLNFTSTVKISLERTTSNFALGENGELFIITSTGWPDYNDAVAKVSMTSGQVLDPAFYTGSGFYGLGYHPSTKDIYIGDNNGFQGNGTVIIVNSSGKEVSTLEVGRAPSGFLFK